MGNGRPRTEKLFSTLLFITWSSCGSLHVVQDSVYKYAQNNTELTVNAALSLTLSRSWNFLAFSFMTGRVKAILDRENQPFIIYEAEMSQRKCNSTDKTALNVDLDYP